jgi:small-conductance mechanosensitive channel
MMARRRVESDVRYRIDHFFRDAGIEIAFPQRDVHVDVPGSLPVRLVADDP